MFTQLQIYGAEKGLSHTNHSVYGYVNGAYITLTLRNRILTLYLPILGVSKKATKEMHKQWLTDVQNIRLVNILQQQYFFQIGMMGRPKEMSVDLIDYFIHMTMKIIRENGGKLNQICRHCGTKTDHFAYDGVQVVPFCPACQQKINREVDQPKNSFFSFIRGFLGAIIGAGLGFLPYVLCSFLAYFTFTPLAFLAPFVSTTCYTWFKGAKNTWFAVFSLVVSVIIMVFFSEALLVLRQIENIFSPLAIHEAIAGNMTYILQSVSFALISIIPAYNSIKNYLQPIKPVAIHPTKQIPIA